MAVFLSPFCFTPLVIPQQDFGIAPAAARCFSFSFCFLGSLSLQRFSFADELPGLPGHQKNQCYQSRSHLINKLWVRCLGFSATSRREDDGRITLPDLRPTNNTGAAPMVRNPLILALVLFKYCRMLKSIHLGDERRPRACATLRLTLILIGISSMES